MEQYQGRIIVQKIAIGRIWFYTKEEQSVKRYKVEDTEKEWDRYEAAKDEAVRELNGLKKRLSGSLERSMLRFLKPMP